MVNRKAGNLHEADKAELPMALEKKEYVVLSEGNSRKKERESWAEMLRRWLVECPRCSEVWLIVGARENERYICKDCGHKFVISFSGVANDRSSDSVLAARRQE
jgi:transposase-like protein